MILYKLGTFDANSPARVESLLSDVAGGTAVDFVVGLGTLAPRSAWRPPQVSTVTLIARAEE